MRAGGLILLIQGALVLVGVAVALYYQGQAGALAALFGGAVAIGNTLLLTRRVRRAGELAADDPKRSMYSLYFGVIQRFVFVVAMLGIGLGGLRLEPVALLATFGAAQLAYLMAAGQQASSA